MNNIKIYCTSIKYFKLLDKLPKYISPLGLGKNKFPSNWLDEKNGENISELNHFYGELSGIYWLWKNIAHKMDASDKIGNCHYRKLWLDDLYLRKQKFSNKSLYSKLLQKDDGKILKYKSIQVQPIVFKHKNLLFDFYEIHQNNILEESINFLDLKYQLNFKKHLSGNTFFPLNMFITNVDNFIKYCEVIFPWLEKCLDVCIKRNLCNGYNTRLPAFLAERFTSFWFSQCVDKIDLSYARLGSYFLSNNLNKIINPTKLPFSFRMYPTIHRY